ncbi:MAG TPA: hypothetical protein VI815_00930 [Candidatus Nanoarchaeia archaeon]|nr:hypothetical protein [Candidatus Nanoarchaeia archaeon]
MKQANFRYYKKNKWGKNGGVPIAVFVLVIATIFLCSYALFTFYTSGQRVNAETNDFAFIDIEYKTSLTEIYLSNIVGKVSLVSNTEEEFLANFNKELLLYKVNGEYELAEMKQFEDKLVLENIMLENNIFAVDIEINLNSYDENSGTYIERTFVKTFNANRI